MEKTVIDRIIPVEHVLRQAKAFLSECGWELEIDEVIVTVPKDAPLAVRSRAFVVADAPDVFLGDHFEATVLLGARREGKNLLADHGVLKMYFDLGGAFVSEDRFSKYQ